MRAHGGKIDEQNRCRSPVSGSTRLSLNSGTVSTTAPNELIFGAGTTNGAFSAEGTNFTTGIITVHDADVAQDRVVTSTGTYDATAPLAVPGAWVMQVATFRAESAPPRRAAGRS